MVQDQETFNARFLAILSNVDNSTATQVRAAATDFQNAFSNLRSELLQLVDKRTPAGQSTSQAIAHTIDKQERNRVLDQWRDAG